MTIGDRTRARADGVAGGVASTRSPLELAVLISCLATVLIPGILCRLPGRLWGVDHLRYWSGVASPAYVLLSALLLTLVFIAPATIFRPVPLGVLRRLPFGARVAAAAGVVLSAFVGWSLRDVTHLLGDGGRTILHASQPGALPFTAPLAAAMHRLVVWSGSQVQVPPVRALELWSCLLGAGMVAIIPAVARAAGLAGGRKLLFVSLLLLSGASQFFCGYIESYPLAYASMVLYLVSGVSALAGRCHWLWPSVALGATIACHLGTAILVPAHAYLVSASARKPSPARVAPAVALLLVPLLVPLLVWIVLRPAPLQTTAGGIFLPWSGPYAIWSPTHLLDLVNELWLVIPAALPLAIGAALAAGAGRVASPVRRFLLLATLTGLGFALVVDPVLGMARDWDLLALGFAPLQVGLAFTVASRPGLTPRAGVLILVTSLSLVAPWIAVNHHPQAAVERYQFLLALDRERPGAAYGYEVLGILFSERGEPEPALAAFAAALRFRPGYERYRQQLRAAVRSLDPPVAHAALSRLVTTDSTSADLEFELAWIESTDETGVTDRGRPALSRPAEARDHWPEGRRWELEREVGKTWISRKRFGPAAAAFDRGLAFASEVPRRAETSYLAGLAHLGAGSCSLAVGRLSAAKALGWTDPDLDFHLGYAHWQCGEDEEARPLLRAFLAAHPGSAFTKLAREILGEN